MRNVMDRRDLEEKRYYPEMLLHSIFFSKSSESVPVVRCTVVSLAKLLKLVGYPTPVN